MLAWNGCSDEVREARLTTIYYRDVRGAWAGGRQGGSPFKASASKRFGNLPLRSRVSGQGCLPRPAERELLKFGPAGWTPSALFGFQYLYLSLLGGLILGQGSPLSPRLLLLVQDRACRQWGEAV